MDVNPKQAFMIGSFATALLLCLSILLLSVSSGAPCNDSGFTVVLNAWLTFMCVYGFWKFDDLKKSAMISGQRYFRSLAEIEDFTDRMGVFIVVALVITSLGALATQFSKLSC